MNGFIVVTAACLVLVFALDAHAYLDPGSGSMFLQLLLGGVAGVLLALKIFWHRILTMLGIKNDRTGRPEDPKR